MSHPKVDSVHSSALSGSQPIGEGTISMKELIERVQQSKVGSLSRFLGTKCPINLELYDIGKTSIVGTLQTTTHSQADHFSRGFGSFLPHGKHEQAMRTALVVGT
jgi:hypothetical protein